MLKFLKKLFGREELTKVQSPYEGVVAYASKDLLVKITRCSFDGANLDGTSPFIYRQTEGGILELVEVRLEGWKCMGPSQAEPKPVVAVDTIELANSLTRH